jgi:hypothetical protein
MGGDVESVEALLLLSSMFSLFSITSDLILSDESANPSVLVAPVLGATSVASVETRFALVHDFNRDQSIAAIRGFDASTLINAPEKYAKARAY